jgi:hypothetical protein
MLKSIQRDMRERFVNWETVNGFFLFMPWGAGFIWYGVPSKELLLQYSIWHERFGYNYGMTSLGVILTAWGLRKVAVNRIKQAVVRERMQTVRKVAQIKKYMGNA